MGPARSRSAFGASVTARSSTGRTARPASRPRSFRGLPSGCIAWRRRAVASAVARASAWRLPVPLSRVTAGVWSPPRARSADSRSGWSFRSGAIPPVAEKVLIVEDEEKLAGLLHDYLAQDGFEVSVLHRGDQVESWVSTHEVDLVLLDLMLPGKSGLEVCKALRAASSELAIIMVTARVEEIDRLLGLELGADDYICKPFSPREVVARVRAVLRRLQPQAPSTAATGGFVLDEQRYCATLDGCLLELTPVEFRLLSTFLAHPGWVFSR